MTGAADFESVALPVAAFTVEKLLGSQYRHTLPIVAFLAWGLLSAFVIARIASIGVLGLVACLGGYALGQRAALRQTLPLLAADTQFNVAQRAGTDKCRGERPRERWGDHTAAGYFDQRSSSSSRSTGFIRDIALGA